MIIYPMAEGFLSVPFISIKFPEIKTHIEIIF